MTRDDFAALALGNGARLPAPSRAASLQRNTTYRDQTMLLVSECSVLVLMLVVCVCSARLFRQRRVWSWQIQAQVSRRWNEKLSGSTLMFEHCKT